MNKGRKNARNFTRIVGQIFRCLCEYSNIQVPVRILKYSGTCADTQIFRCLCKYSNIQVPMLILKYSGACAKTQIFRYLC